MSDTTPVGAPSTNGDVRVLLAITAPRTRMHIRRLLASGPGIDVIGHVPSAMQSNSLLQRGNVDFIIVEAPEDPGFVQGILGAARTAGIEVALLTDDSRLSSQCLTSRVHLLRPPPDITTVLPQSPFCQSLLDTVLRKASTARRPSADAVLRPRVLRTGVPDLIAIGSSTGGPQALPLVLGPLRKRIRQPIVITQHMPPAFTKLLAEHLERSTSFPTAARVGTDPDHLR
jgi:two-component system chemotaxis response regulator CheB